MPGDYTRSVFDSFKDHLGVLMEQGRVLLDADFNEFVHIMDRRFRSETIDIIGRCVVPRETPDGFRITLSGGVIMIGRGRLYCDGIQAENHGLPPLEFDRVLAEERGTLPIPYSQQPYLPDGIAPPPNAGGPHLVYVDVWQREVTHLEEPEMVEKAVGVDTATRLQTVWQVKVLRNVGNITCATPDDQVPRWLDIIAPSAGRLTTSAVGVPADTDPCVVNPAGGFRGTENRLYRVEVHDPGPLGTATFKWSRDNASIGTSVTAINAGLDVLTVTRTARDAVLRFSPGDWVEVTDDHREFAGLAGEMRKVRLVDDVAETITLTSALTAGTFDTANPVSRHTRVRRWDQQGLVFDAANNVVADVDASNGVIPIPTSGSMVLEDGVQVEFTAAVPAGSFHAGDYWLIAARTVDASIDIVTAAPPKGIHHHFCRLAIITFPDGVSDCRTLWPPPFGDRGCDCTQCVTAESHNSGAFTIQMAIELVKPTGGKVCLGPGIFNLGTTPVRIHDASSVQLEGRGWRTILVYAGGGAAVSVARSTGIDIEMLSVLAFSRSDLPAVAVGLQNSVLVRVQRCLLGQSGGRRRLEGAIGLNGFLVETLIRDNVLIGSGGVVAIASTAEERAATVEAARILMLSLRLRIEGNVISTSVRGVSLDGLSLLLGDTRIAGNSIYGNSQAAIFVTSLVFSDALTSSRLDITGNELLLTGHGILVASDNARIADNDIGVLVNPQASTPSGTGIMVTGGLGGPMDRLQILANRITGLGGDGILLQNNIASAIIKLNIIDRVRSGGIVTSEEGQFENLSIENNQILRSGLLNERTSALAAIRAARVERLQVVGNSIDQFALGAVQAAERFGIQVVACRSVRIEGNDLSNIGPPAQFVNRGGGIVVQAPFDRVDVAQNSVRRGTPPAGAVDSSNWNAVLISSPVIGPGNLLFPFVADVPSGLMFIGNFRIALLTPGREVVAVRGNLLEAYGIAPTVTIGVSDSCVFSDNRCLLDGPPTAGSVVAAISSGAAIVSANLFRRLPPADQFITLALTTGNAPFTLVGNIARGGRIVVNGAPPPAPWTPLNVVLFS